VTCATGSFKGVPEELESSRLALQERRFLSTGVKYTLDDAERESVHTLLGTYDRSFREVLSQQPEALAEAERAVPYQYASLGVLVLGTAYAVSQMVDAAGNSSEAQTFGELDEASGQVERAFFAAVGAALFSALLNTPARTHLYDAVTMFNGGLDSSESPPEERGLAQRVFSGARPSARLSPALWRLDLGVTLRTGRRR
jgi:hypothetical protein